MESLTPPPLSIEQAKLIGKGKLLVDELLNLREPLLAEWAREITEHLIREADLPGLCKDTMLANLGNGK